MGTAFAGKKGGVCGAHNQRAVYMDGSGGEGGGRQGGWRRPYHCQIELSPSAFRRVPHNKVAPERGAKLQQSERVGWKEQTGQHAASGQREQTMQARDQIGAVGRQPCVPGPETYPVVQRPQDTALAVDDVLPAIRIRADVHVVGNLPRVDLENRRYTWAASGAVECGSVPGSQRTMARVFTPAHQTGRPNRAYLLVFAGDQQRRRPGKLEVAAVNLGEPEVPAQDIYPEEEAVLAQIEVDLGRTSARCHIGTVRACTSGVCRGSRR